MRSAATKDCETSVLIMNRKGMHSSYRMLEDEVEAVQFSVVMCECACVVQLLCLCYQ